MGWLRRTRRLIAKEIKRDRGKTCACEDTIRLREMYGTSSRECAAFPRTKNSCLASDLTAPWQVNKNFVGTRMACNYELPIYHNSDPTRDPTSDRVMVCLVIANRNWRGMSIARYRLLEKLEFRDLKESRSMRPSCLDNFVVELRVFLVSGVFRSYNRRFWNLSRARKLWMVAIVQTNVRLSKANCTR